MLNVSSRHQRIGRGAAVMEYIMLIIIIISALAIFRTGITRAFIGQWKNAGDSFGFGRQYDPDKTKECSYTQIKPEYGLWYDEVCYRARFLQCPAGNLKCEDEMKAGCKTDLCCEGVDKTDNNCGPNSP